MAKAPSRNGTGRTGGAAQGAAAAPRRRGLRLLSLLIAIVLVVLFFDSVFVLLAGLIPTGVAYLVDRNPNKHAARTVGWLNLAGCLVVLLDLWDGSGGLGAALSLLGDPFNWLIMFGGAAIGWGVFFALPPIVSGYLALSQEMKLKELARRQKRLEREWGEAVRESAPLETLEAVEEELLAVQRREAAGTDRAAGAGGETGGGGDDAEAESEEDLGDLSDTPAGRTPARPAAKS